MERLWRNAWPHCLLPPATRLLPWRRSACGRSAAVRQQPARPPAATRPHQPAHPPTPYPPYRPSPPNADPPVTVALVAGGRTDTIDLKFSTATRAATFLRVRNTCLLLPSARWDDYTYYLVYGGYAVPTTPRVGWRQLRDSATVGQILGAEQPAAGEQLWLLLEYAPPPPLGAGTFVCCLLYSRAFLLLSYHTPIPARQVCSFCRCRWRRWRHHN